MRDTAVDLGQGHQCENHWRDARDSQRATRGKLRLLLDYHASVVCSTCM